MKALLDNPLMAWGLSQARREKRFRVGVGVFLLVFYGIVMLTVLTWSNSFAPKLQTLLTSFHFEAWGICLAMLLVWAPARMAQTIAREKEQGTLDMLRLTGLSGDELAVGYVATSLSLPLFLCCLTAPVMLLGIGGEGGIASVIRGYVCLLVLAPFYVLAGGLAGLAVKKAQHAGSAAIFFSLVTLSVSGAGLSSWDSGPLAIFGPWGGGLASTVNETAFYVIPILGQDVPGDLVQLVFVVLFTRAMLMGLGRRFAGEPAVILGRTGALIVLAGVAALSALTLYPSSLTPGRWGGFGGMIPVRTPTRSMLTSHVIVVFMPALLYALESPIRWRDLVRGRSRRGEHNATLVEERFDLARFAPALAVVGVFTGALVLVVAYASYFGGSDQVSVVAVLLAVSILVLAATVAAVSVQVALLTTRGVGSPRLLAGLALVVLWIGPLMASYILAAMGAPAGLYQLPRAVNPWYGIAMASHANDVAMGQRGLGPLALGMTCAAVHLFLAMALVSSLRTSLERAADHANSLVALPADAYAAPGTLTQRCGEGHMYSAAWEACPHCAPSASAAAAGEALLPAVATPEARPPAPGPDAP